MSEAPLLQLQNVVVDFDGFKAINDLSLSIPSGSMTVVIGPNGAVIVPTMGLGQPLGILPQPALDLQTVVIPPGGVLLLYTDGVTEAVDPGGNFFETERLYVTARLTAGYTAQVICDRLLEAVTAHRGPAPQADDVTLVAVHAI